MDERFDSEKAATAMEITPANPPIKDVLTHFGGSIIYGKAQSPLRKRVMIGIPVTGLVRVEWMLGRYGQVIPCNWSQTDAFQWMTTEAPLNFLVPDARNMIVASFLREGFEWLFFIDHDTIPPMDCFVRWNERMLKGDVPVWCGLYWTKSIPSEPILYRGFGNGYYYADWKIGEEVWVDGIPMGCTVIHRSILEVMWHNSEPYSLPQYGGVQTRRVFENPHSIGYDPQEKAWIVTGGTEDLRFCERVIKEKVFEKAGWGKIAEKEFPFLVDTKVMCRHIDNAGLQYPAAGEEEKFMPKEKEKPA